MDKHLKRVAIISGGTGYVGAAIARRLAKDGFMIAVLYRTQEDGAKQLIAELPGKGHRAYRCDLQKQGAAETTVAEVERDMGAPYACVHAAGAMPKAKPLSRSSVEDLREQLEENVLSGFSFISACAHRLKEGGKGVIIGVTTANVVTDTNTKARGAYSVVKFAIQGILNALREELGPSGVRVYSLAPGVLEGGMNSATPRAFLDIVRSQSPTGRIASVEEVADAASFLISDEKCSFGGMTYLVAPEIGQ